MNLIKYSIASQVLENLSGFILGSIYPILGKAKLTVLSDVRPVWTLALKVKYFQIT